MPVAGAVSVLMFWPPVVWRALRLRGKFLQLPGGRALPEALPSGELVRQCWLAVFPGGPVLELGLAGTFAHIRGIPVLFGAPLKVPVAISPLIRVEVADRHHDPPIAGFVLGAAI